MGNMVVVVVVVVVVGVWLGTSVGRGRRPRTACVHDMWAHSFLSRTRRSKHSGLPLARIQRAITSRLTTPQHPTSTRAPSQTPDPELAMSSNGIRPTASFRFPPETSVLCLIYPLYLVHLSARCMCSWILNSYAPKPAHADSNTQEQNTSTTKTHTHPPATTKLSPRVKPWTALAAPEARTWPRLQITTNLDGTSGRERGNHYPTRTRTQHDCTLPNKDPAQTGTGESQD